MARNYQAVRRSPKRYMGETVADVEYQKGLEAGMTPKDAAKQAQNLTGLSLLTGQRMKTKGFGWQNLSRPMHSL